MVELQFGFRVILLHEHEEGHRTLDIPLDLHFPVAFNRCPALEVVVPLRGLDLDVALEVGDIAVDVAAVIQSVSPDFEFQLSVLIM